MQQSGGKWGEECDVVIGLLAEFPELEIVQKWGADVYTFNGKNVVSFGGFKHFFSVWFYNGVFIDDKFGVLVNASEGKTKSLRQWRFTSGSEMDREKIREYIQQAIQIEKQGLKVELTKFIPETLPVELENTLANDQKLKKAFELLTPGKQKEYALFIKEAKQEATKFKRLEKIIPMILEGKGLNDKYKK